MYRIGRSLSAHTFPAHVYLCCVGLEGKGTLADEGLNQNKGLKLNQQSVEDKTARMVHWARAREYNPPGMHA